MINVMALGAASGPGFVMGVLILIAFVRTVSARSPQPAVVPGHPRRSA
jgi:hypothetical protein